MQQILPLPFPVTTVFGYEGIVINPNTCKPVYWRSSPGPTFEAVRGIPINVQWVNNLTNPNLFAAGLTYNSEKTGDESKSVSTCPKFSTEFFLEQGIVPIVTHLHGGEVRSDSDGGPNSWFSTGEWEKGLNFSKSRYTYPNGQRPTTLWYHDHVLGIASVSVYAGLSGFYLLRDPDDNISLLLPNEEYEIPMVIQDRSFYEDGSLLFPDNGGGPSVHLCKGSAFIGDTIMVNGKVWPNLNVERRQYRFRILNGSNTRTYNLKLSNNQPFIQIGSDGGYLPYPVRLTELLIAPAERADVLVDFSTMEPDTSVIMINDAKVPFPNGATPDPETVGQIMKFTILNTHPVPPIVLPEKLNDIPILIPDVPKKTFTLNVVKQTSGRAPKLLLNGQKWGSPVTESPIVGSTVEWEIVNLTTDAHPIHVHLIQFLIANRQDFDKTNYEDEWIQLNGKPPLFHPTITLPVEPFLTGNPIDPSLNERGWKDTVLALPGKVTRLKLRFAPQDAEPNKVKPGVNLFPFDPTIGPGYVWHCHILDHVDNEMIRPIIVIGNPAPTPNPQSCCQVMVEGSTELLPPALMGAPIVNKNKVFASIDAVYPGKIIISGFIRNDISYTGVLEDGTKEGTTVINDVPFQCMANRDDANESDSYNITGMALSCKIYERPQNFGINFITKEKVAYKFLGKDIVTICIRRTVI
ncbi:MAG: multicopper oxidase family protein [Sedimentibacter sp.]